MNFCGIMDLFLKDVGEWEQCCNHSSEVNGESLPVVGKEGCLVDNYTIGCKVVESCVELVHAPGRSHLMVLEGMDYPLHLI